MAIPKKATPRSVWLCGGDERLSTFVCVEGLGLGGIGEVILH